MEDNGALYSSSTEYLDGFHYVSSTEDELWWAFYEESGSAYEPEAFVNMVSTMDLENVLKFFPTSEGFYDFENNEYIYQYKDHLGNVRLSYKDEGNQNPIVTDSNDYYSFGMSFVRNSEEDAHFGAGSYYNYKYNGKELQETGMYDYGWRQYMPDIGRSYGMDQLGEHPYQIDKSPYAFTWNNPVNFVDPDGNCPDCPSNYDIGQSWLSSDGIWYTREEGSWRGANRIVHIDGVVVPGGSSSGSFSSFSWGGLLGIGSGSSGGGSSGIGGGWGSPGNGWGIYGGGAPFPIKQRPVDDLEKQMNRKQQLEYERLQNSKIDDIATGLGINMNVKKVVINYANDIGDIGNSGKSLLKITNTIGRLTGIYGALSSTNDFLEKPSWHTGTKAALSILSVTKFVNPTVGIIMGISDISGFTDWTLIQIYGK